MWPGQTLQLASFRLGELLLLFRAELDRRVPVTLRRAETSDGIRGDLEHGDGHHRAICLEDLGHADLAADQSDAHRSLLRRIAALAPARLRSPTFEGRSLRGSSPPFAGHGATATRG